MIGGEFAAIEARAAGRPRMNTNRSSGEVFQELDLSQIDTSVEGNRWREEWNDDEPEGDDL